MTQAEGVYVTVTTIFLQSICCYSVVVCLGIWEVLILRMGIMIYITQYNESWEFKV